MQGGRTVEFLGVPLLEPQSSPRPTAFPSTRSPSSLFEQNREETSVTCMQNMWVMIGGFPKYSPYLCDDCSSE